jgi:hypothetical protein
MLLASLGCQIDVAPALSAMAPAGVFAMSDLAIHDGSNAFPALQRQMTETRTDSSEEPDSAAEPGRIAALTTIVTQQGTRSAGNLERVSSVEVLNLTASPEFVVDTRVERAAAAQAAAEAAAIEAARSDEVAAEAQAEADAAVTAALAADQQQDDARAAALAVTQEAETSAAVDAALAADQADDEAEVAALVATQEAEASAAVAAALAADQKKDAAQAATVAATRQAEAAAADATATAEAQAASRAVREADAATARAEAQTAAAVENNRQFVQRVTILLVSLALLIGGFLCLRFWRNRKEPFVLKANPGSGAAHARA